MNYMYVHPKKTDFVMFGTVQKLNQCDDVLLGDKVLNEKPFHKYFGLYLDI